jgi:hypothetical protein
MKIRKLVVFAVVLISSFLLSSCLTCETKDYSFELNNQGGGKFTIKFNNIMSKKDKEELTKDEETTKDFEELISKYIKETEMEKTFPDAKMVEKRLYAENGKLNGIVVFEFSKIDQVKLYQYDKNSPFQYYLSSLSSESFSATNGKQAPDYFPVINWDKSLKKLTLTTKVTEVSNESTTSLLSVWEKNKK